MRIFFILIVTAVFGIIHGYVGWRVIPPLGLSPPFRGMAWIFLVCLTFAPLVPAILRFNGLENRLVDWLSAAGYTSLGFFVLTFLAFLLRDILFGIGITGGKLLAKPDISSALPLANLNWSILVVTATLTIVGLWQARQTPVIEKVTIPIRDLPAELEDFTIVQISDIHVGPTIKRSFVEKVAQAVSELKPDLIALTGDLVDGSVPYLTKDVEPLRKLSAPYGKYFITGNHEYYSGVEPWLEKTRELGFTNLVNQNTTVFVKGFPLSVLGVTDLTAHQITPSHKSDVAGAMEGVDTSAFTLLLAHQPGSVFAAAEAGIDLMLTGHTHAGQFIPFNWIVARAHPYLEGLHQHEHLWLYVNRGTGYWGPPLRLGMTNEITLLTLKRAVS